MRIFVLSSLGMAVIFTAIFFYQSFSFAKNFTQAETLDSHSLLIGDENASLRVVEFLDYGCPFCPSVHQTLVEASQLEGGVALVVRPVGWSSPESEQMAKFLMATADQGKLKDLHVRFMQSPTPSLVALKAMAQLEGVDIAKAEKAMAENQQPLYNEILMNKLNIKKIPAVILNKDVFIPNDTLPTVNQFRLMIQEIKK